MPSRFLIFRCADGQMLLDATEDVPFLYDNAEDIGLDGQFIPVYLVPAEEYEALQKDGDSTIKILQQILVILDDDRATRAEAIYLCRQYLNVAKFLKGATDEP